MHPLWAARPAVKCTIDRQEVIGAGVRVVDIAAAPGILNVERCHGDRCRRHAVDDALAHDLARARGRELLLRWRRWCDTAAHSVGHIVTIAVRLGCVCISQVDGASAYAVGGTGVGCAAAVPAECEAGAPQCEAPFLAIGQQQLAAHFILGPCVLHVVVTAVAGTEDLQVNGNKRRLRGRHASQLLLLQSAAIVPEVRSGVQQ
eukprot:2324753-Prymnesium_polylepis.2